MRLIGGTAIALLAVHVSMSHMARAEVVAATDAGFILSTTDTVAASPDEVWEVLRSPARYWSKDHSWTGDAANLWMDAQAGGCFCEKIPGSSLMARGSVEHARIIYAAPGKMLRMRGALGPMQGEAVTGTLTWTFEPLADGTRVTVRYAVSGFREGGLAELAPAVDSVLTQQVAGLKNAVEQGVDAAPDKAETK